MLRAGVKIPGKIADNKSIRLFLFAGHGLMEIYIVTTPYMFIDYHTGRYHMVLKDKKHKRSLKKVLSTLTASAIALSCYGGVSVSAAEQAEKVYKGIADAQVVLNNLDYYDVRNSGTWATEAIYETGALDVIKGYGDKRFGRTDIVTKEQAIAIAYRVAGREADAQKAAEELDNARNRDEKKKNALSMWSDGYLKLAADDGLLSKEDLADAFNPDPSTLDPSSFYRGAPAERQEMGFWLAKALKLEPAYNQQELFNSYRDWKESDPVKIPYLEAALKNNIMNGDGNGRFNPRQSLTREQAAQIVKNASRFMLPTLHYEKLTGTIENMGLSRTLPGGQRMETATLDIRNLNGKLHQVTVGYINTPGQSDRNEQNGQMTGATILDLVVYKNGNITNSSALEIGDRLEYIVAPDNTVKYVKVASNEVNTQYLVAQLKNIDPQKLTLSVSPFFTLDTSDMTLAQRYASFSPIEGKTVDSYIYSNNVSVKSKGRNVEIKSLKPDAYVLLTIVNDMVTAIETFDVNQVREEEKGIVSGMVEENNPELGYITLYREDGTGTGPDALEAGLLRTYTYSPKSGIEAYKNHKKVDISEIGAGDSIFLKLDDQSNVVAASAASNYAVKYGKVRSIGTSSMAVEYEDGQQQVLDIDENTLVTVNGQKVDPTSIKDGDNLRLILQITGQGTRVKEIALSGRERDISNIYKGTFSYADKVSNTIVLKNAEVLDKDRWQRTGQKGFISIKLGDRYNVYANNQITNIDRADQLLRENEVYVAAGKEYDGEERAVMLSFRNPKNPEAPVVYDDTVSGIGQGIGQITLYKENKNLKVTPGTIVVRNGKLVPGSSIRSNDNAYVVAGMDMGSGELYAGVVNIGERYTNSALQIYRGRIRQINDNKDFTVESFSELNGLSWNYWNTPKTFGITYDTRILNDSGVVSQRDFKTYGDESYKDKTVYIAAKDGQALLVSTASFSNPFHVKGEIYDTGSGSSLKLHNAKIYDPNNLLWNDSKDITLTVLKNSVIIKGGTVINASALKKGDRIQAVKKDKTTAGDAYIIFVE